MPTGDEMFRLLNALDLAYKCEMILYQLHSIIFWTSILEITLFFSLLFVFFASPSLLGLIWLTIAHVPRGVLGFMLLKFLPKSHEIVEDLDIEDMSHSSLTIEKLQEKIHFSLTIQFIQKAGSSKNLMMFYSIVTIVCYLLDALTFIIAYRMFSVPGNEHTEILLLMATLIFIAIDFYYVIWLNSLKSKLPTKMADIISQAIMGYTKKMRRDLIENLNKTKQKDVNEALATLEKKKEAQMASEQKAKDAAKAQAEKDKAAKKGEPKKPAEPKGGNKAPPKK